MTNSPCSFGKLSTLVIVTYSVKLRPFEAVLVLDKFNIRYFALRAAGFCILIVNPSGFWQTCAMHNV